MGAEPHAGKPAGRQEAEPGKLRAGSIGVPSAMVMSIAIMAPAAGMIFLPQVVASHAGAAVPLVYLMSLIACLFIAGTVTQFIPILILYILACLSLIVYMRRLRAAGQVRYNLFKHLI